MVLNTLAAAVREISTIKPYARIFAIVISALMLSISAAQSQTETVSAKTLLIKLKVFQILNLMKMTLI